MSDGSIIDRQRPDAGVALRALRVAKLLRVTSTARLVAAALLVITLPGCLAYHLHDENPLTIDMPDGDGMVEIYDGNEPLPTLRGPSAREQLQRELHAELYDATEEEKADWIRDIQLLDPEQARYALKMRREMLNRKAAAAKAFKKNSATAPEAAFPRKTAQMPPELSPDSSTVAATSSNPFASQNRAAKQPTFGHSGQPQGTPSGDATLPDAETNPFAASSIPVQTPDGANNVQLVDGIDSGNIANRTTRNNQPPPLPQLPLPQGSQQPALQTVPSTRIPVNRAPGVPDQNPFAGTGVVAPSGPNGEANIPEQRPGIRDRFSKWGARFGFGNDGEQQMPVEEIAEPLIQTAPNPMPADRQPVANLQMLILRRENTLRNLGSAAPVDDRQRQDFIRQHVELRLLYMMSGQQSRALGAIPGISPSEQEFWQQVLWGLADYFDLEGKANRIERISQTVKQFETAVDRLKEEAQLSIHNLNFCRKISSFGSYERFRRDDFTAGQPVLVYAEIDNFKSTSVADGKYRTLLTSRIEIFKGDARGRMIDSVTFKPTEDLCRSPRRDYFHSYELTIPQNIALGPHTLVLTIEDQATGKQATQSVSFVVK